MIVMAVYTVGVVVIVLVKVLVVKGATTVVVVLLTPIQEQADEYRAVPEHAEA